MKWLSLFSGIGGFDLALRNQGHQVVGACEIDQHARLIYERHFPGVPIHEDATKIIAEDLPDIDGIVAGFPCQTFSIAGNRLGFEESRGTLFFEIARIAKQKRPRYLLLENVKGLLSHDGGKTFAEILATLDELGYDAEWQVLNSKYYIPQNRERIFIIGYLRGTSRPKIFPLGEISEGSSGKIKKVAGYSQCNTIYDTEGIAPSLAAGTHGYCMGTIVEPELKQIGNIDKKGHNSVWGRVYDTDGIATTQTSEGGGLGAKGGLYAVMNPDLKNKSQNGRTVKEPGEPSFTLTAQDKHGISDGKKIRRLTPVECERLQTFPDGWTEGISDTQRYKCIGNAVTVKVVEDIVSRLER